jgi:hypothetical protein
MREIADGAAGEGGEGGAGGAPVATSADPSDATGDLDVLGYVIPRSAAASWTSRTLLSEIGAPVTSMLLVDFGRGPEVRPALATAATELRARGIDVTATVVPTEETWWFARATIPTDEPVVDRTCTWITGILA